jgi:hypothetical protein
VQRVHYASQPFQREPDFHAHSVNYGFAELLSKGVNRLDHETRRLEMGRRELNQPRAMKQVMIVKGIVLGSLDSPAAPEYISESWDNEILHSLDKLEDFVHAIVEFFEAAVHCVRRPFQREPDFHAHSVNYGFAELLARSQIPQ